LKKGRKILTFGCPSHKSSTQTADRCLSFACCKSQVMCFELRVRNNWCANGMVEQ